MRIDPLNPLAPVVTGPAVPLKKARQKRGTPARNAAHSVAGGRSAKSPGPKVTLNDVRVTVARAALRSPTADVAKIVSQIPLATFAHLLQCDKAIALQSRERFIAYCAQHPAAHDWRVAWNAFQKENQRPTLNVQRPTSNAERTIIPFPAQTAADAVSFIDAL